MVVRYPIDHLGNQNLAFLDKLLQADRLLRHTDEAAIIVERHIFAPRRKEFVNGPRVTFQADNERGAQSIIDSFVGQQFASVEEIARMLAVEGGQDFSRIKIGKGQNQHFGEAKRLFHDFSHGPRFKIVDAAAQDRRYVDLASRAIRADEKMRSVSPSGLLQEFEPAIAVLTRAAIRPMAASIAASDSA